MWCPVIWWKTHIWTWKRRRGKVCLLQNYPSVINRKYYLILPLIILGILILESIILYLTGSGSSMTDFNIYEFLITLVSYFVIYFFAVWTLYFGEELGWKVYLQDRLFPLLGGYKGVLVLGIIWGIWHYPMNAMGYNFPGQPILGNALMTAFTISFGII